MYHMSFTTVPSYLHRKVYIGHGVQVLVLSTDGMFAFIQGIADFTKDVKYTENPIRRIPMIPLSIFVAPCYRSVLSTGI